MVPKPTLVASKPNATLQELCCQALLGPSIRKVLAAGQDTKPHGGPGDPTGAGRSHASQAHTALGITTQSPPAFQTRGFAKISGFKQLLQGVSLPNHALAAPHQARREEQQQLPKVGVVWAEGRSAPG